MSAQEQLLAGQPLCIARGVGDGGPADDWGVFLHAGYWEAWRAGTCRGRGHARGATEALDRAHRVLGAGHRP